MKVIQNASDVPEEIITLHREITKNPDKDIRLRIALSCLFHDSGKVSTREFVSDGQVQFHEHQFKSSKIASKVLKRLGFGKKICDLVADDCLFHMIRDDPNFEKIVQQGIKKSSFHSRQKKTPIEKIIDNLSFGSGKTQDLAMGHLNELVRWHIIRSDNSGRNKRSEILVEKLILISEKVRKQRDQEEEEISFMKPLIKGDELMKIFGLPAGPWIGEVHKKMIEDKKENPKQTYDIALEIAKSAIEK